MPYFIYSVGPLNILEKRGVAPEFRQARAMANEMRKQLEPKHGAKIKIIFAESELAAEDTLSQPRELDASLAGDDY